VRVKKTLLEIISANKNKKPEITETAQKKPLFRAGKTPAGFRAHGFSTDATE